MANKTLKQKAEDYAKQNPTADLCQAWLDGYNAALKSKSRKKALDLSFVDAEYTPAIAKWLTYKNERKQPYTQIGIETCYKHLVSLSCGDPTTAMAIVEQSISNNWAGLFELKNGTITSISTRSNSQFQSPGQRKASVNDLAHLAEGVLQGLGGNIGQ